MTLNHQIYNRYGIIFRFGVCRGDMFVYLPMDTTPGYFWKIN